MPKEFPIFSQSKYETGHMLSRCDEYQSSQEDIKTIMEFLEAWDFKAPGQKLSVAAAFF